MCERCWGKAFTAAYGIGSKTQAGEYERIVASCACAPWQRFGVADSFAEGYKARLAEDAKVRAGLVEALQDLLAYAESQICSHEETHRGGAIWEICDICGDCWADDDGGKPPRQDPEEIVATRSALLAAAKERG